MNEFMPPRAPSQSGVGRHEHADALAGDLLHLALAPEAGVGGHDVGIAESERGELALGGADHRFEMAEVRCLGGDLGGDDDLALVDRQLGVVALHPRPPPAVEPAAALDEPALGHHAQHALAVHRPAEPPPHPRRHQPVAVGRVGLDLGDDRRLDHVDGRLVGDADTPRGFGTR